MQKDVSRLCPVIFDRGTFWHRIVCIVCTRRLGLSNIEGAPKEVSA